MRKLAYFAAVALLCTGIAVAQSTTTDQSSSSSTTAQQPSSTNPGSSAATTPSSTDNAATTDQTGQTGAANTGTKKSGKKLPQTASPLPLLLLLGMGMIGAGGVSRVRNFGHR
jgi:LPXTG-motif cell wall-anchored protein